MSKLIFAGFCAVAALGLTACGTKHEENNVAAENTEDLNAATDLNMDVNATDMNASSNMTMSSDANSTGATGNEATGNSSGY